MQSTKSHEVIFSEKLQEQTFTTIFSLLKSIHDTTTTKGIFLAPDHAKTILVLDSKSQRAIALANFLYSAGYRPLVVGSTLEAFTSFLQGSYTPFVLVLGQYDPSTRLFLTRLQQQIMRIHRWDVPLINLLIQESHSTTSTTQKNLPNTEHAIMSNEYKLPESTVPQTDPLPYYPPILEQAFSRSNYGDNNLTQQPVTMPLKPLKSSTYEIKPIINVSPFDTQINQQPMKRISLEQLSIGRYQMQSLLGNGPIGQVYLTYDRLRERDVALKAIQLNSLTAEVSSIVTSETNFFQREIDEMSPLEHPNILSPLNCGKSYISGSPFIFKTMTHYPDGSLATLLYQMKKTQLLPQRDVIVILSQIADALQHAHNHNVLFQNFKLSNFLIRNFKKGTQDIHVMVSDFWVARSNFHLLKTPEMFPYIAPESWSDHAQPASDQYGLAVLAYKLLTGHTPFQGNAERIMQQLHRAMPPQPLTTHSPSISVGLSNVVLRALAKEPEERFSTMQHFAAALQQKGL